MKKYLIEQLYLIDINGKKVIALFDDSECIEIKTGKKIENYKIIDSLKNILINQNLDIFIVDVNGNLKEVLNIDEIEFLYQVLQKKLSFSQTGLQRIRPVYLTTTTTILGLVPMALKLNIDFINADITIGSPSMDMWAAFSKSVIFGLGFATILTLIVTPCMILIGVQVRAKFKWWWQNKFSKKSNIEITE